MAQMRQYPWNLGWIILMSAGLLSGACGKGEQGVSSPPISVIPAGEWRTWNFDQVPAGQLPSGVTAQKTGSGTLPKWIVAKGDQMECFYDGTQYLAVRDPTFTRGKIGLWTKADAVSYFDELRVRPIK
ncbi:MAG: hypothetical protein HYY11_10120 [Candidatus Methylomirabilis oxyfera]|nr:hypothetical protein [Candidatus Methylomirabilis oxyfera]